ncbi:MAG: hypothetical protein ACJ0F8_00115 [Gammaproteobacteria bacterium]|uniref:Uncharacterized protein n=1 Tax=SAR86 cluster bacterium TaxID=2030880 RepID=A0A520MXI4_9GAMM|nr:hypothetical protein [Gammaproteobacteria bacterium]MBA4730355.1 hypothetical protein [SAR86 cluster bacterium]RZO25932.1 MAG: hypothetical protein EVA92_04245 [SAR86 cluster bacterium]|tara:strand:+ start:2015 stop:2326 length:312 start_codon:yes stop_codon:yes gene_type:complete
MKSLGIGLAYLMIYTSPIQVFLILWGLWIVLTSDYTFLGLSSKDFLYDNLLILHDFAYSLFWGSEIWHAFLNFWYQFPMVIMVFLKLVFNTWFGLWLLKKLKP